MAIVVPSVAATVLLDALLDVVTPYCHLYVVDVDLGPDTTLADLTEASWTGYVPQKATGWTPSEWETDRAKSAADPLLWTYGTQPGPAPVYGYYVTDGLGGGLLWCEAREQGPVTLTLPLDDVEIWPRLTLRTDPDPV